MPLSSTVEARRLKLECMKNLAILKSDPFLAPYAGAINGRYEYFEAIEKKLVPEGQNLSNFATGYLYFGLHRGTDGWVFREWAPNATAIFLIGDFNNWQRHPDYQLKEYRMGSGRFACRNMP